MIRRHSRKRSATHSRLRSRTTRLEQPDLFRQFPFNLAAHVLAPGDLRAEPEQLAHLRSFAHAGDPLADDWVAATRRMPRGTGRFLFERALTEGLAAVDDPPTELRALFESIQTTPYWLDRAKLERGARAIARAGLLGLAPLGDLSLMGGYLASRATKTLVATGELEDMAVRRLSETALWWLEVTTPGALDRFGDGFTATLRVRMTHAHIRAAMQRRDDWDYDAWDAPINQVQTVGTLLLFSLVFIVGLQALGLRYSRDEKEGMFHLWRYVGWLMGVDEDLLPGDEDDAWRLLWLLASTEFIPDDDTRRLGQALLATWGNLLPKGLVMDQLSKALLRLNGSFSRMVLGKRNAEILGLPNDPASQALVAGLAMGTYGVETMRRRIPGATRLAEVVGQVTRRELMTRSAARAGADRSFTRSDDRASGPSGPSDFAAA